MNPAEVLFCGVMISYRLRPGFRHPAFTAGELYRFIEETYPTGYIFVEVDGRARCVWEANFDRIEEAAGASPGGAQ